ncbi:predicted protein [Sclerotinia sclerotiorum 1980 UF-70]|uniref:Uncharacterized protein n=1 Tax=Sclerotinia sclerotiorum (strain ATCC 18683 / 1980 / Ss-1) TaxID=665079 RepID=A7EJY7_SCLS1|nr:predicted protein [Sclerotinia sclerotiorum 1980 UF-70]EDO03153.1 predicted protein [Sclerotinia sclerotiorum 1980 UF-70]
MNYRRKLLSITIARPTPLVFVDLPKVYRVMSCNPHAKYLADEKAEKFPHLFRTE